MEIRIVTLDSFHYFDQIVVSRFRLQRLASLPLASSNKRRLANLQPGHILVGINQQDLSHHWQHETRCCRIDALGLGWRAFLAHMPHKVSLVKLGDTLSDHFSMTLR